MVIVSRHDLNDELCIVLRRLSASQEGAESLFSPPACIRYLLPIRRG